MRLRAVEIVWRNSKKLNPMKEQTRMRWYFDSVLGLYRFLPAVIGGDIKTSQLPLSSTKDSCAQDFDY
jgi:hypothetical protein